MAGSDRVPDPNDSKRARGWKAQTTTRGKWRSSLSAYKSVLQNVLDTADIVRDGDVSPSDSVKATTFTYLRWEPCARQPTQALQSNQPNRRQKCRVRIA